VETSAIPQISSKHSKGFMFVRRCLWIFLGAILYFIVESIWPGTKRSVEDRLFQALFCSALVCTFSFGLPFMPSRPQTIAIDGDMIVFKRNGGFKKMYLGDIRTVIERKTNILRDGGLMISDRTEFRARLVSGFLWIPETAPNYDYLKSVVELWTSSSR
jgi:hypothetical protein